MLKKNKKKREKEQRSIIIDPGRLPIFSVANAIHTAYNAAIVRLANTLNLGAFEPIDTFLYRVYVNDPQTDEGCRIVQKGATGAEPTGLPFEIFITLMAILQIKLYQGTYSGGGASVFISEPGAVSRIQILFAERPEFEVFDLHCLGEGDDAEAQKES